MPKQHREHRLWPWVMALALGAIAVAVIVVTPILVPKTVLCVGDSLTSGAAQALNDQLQAKGFDPVLHAIPGSGLLDTKVNWADTARQLVAQFNPDVVVVEFIGEFDDIILRPGFRIQCEADVEQPPRGRICGGGR